MRLLLLIAYTSSSSYRLTTLSSSYQAHTNTLLGTNNPRRHHAHEPYTLRMCLRRCLSRGLYPKVLVLWRSHFQGGREEQDHYEKMMRLRC